MQTDRGLEHKVQDKSNGNRNNNRKSKGSCAVAIVHVVMKSSSEAPPAAAHSDYLTRQYGYKKRGLPELVESDNMPAFAQNDPRRFWVAADQHERVGGRKYTELQIALPRELGTEERKTLVRDATREFLGDRFAYTVVVHTPVGKDKIGQPHMHLMFSERVVDETTRALPESCFFKRNGARKDPAWNKREKPFEIRERWCVLMNAAMERAGHKQRVDPRSWAEQGRGDLAELVEPKLIAGSRAEARALHAEVDQLREQRAQRPPMHLDGEAVIQKIEQEAAAKLAAVDAWEAQELSRLEKLIAVARELAAEAKRRTVAAAQKVVERAGQWAASGNRRSEGGQQNAQAQTEKQGSPAAPRPVSEDAERLRRAVEWFVGHGHRDPTQLMDVQRSPKLLCSRKEQMAEMAKDETEKAGWLEHGVVVYEHLVQKRLQPLRERFPQETEQRLRTKAAGYALKVPLGQVQERANNERERSQKNDLGR